MEIKVLPIMMQFHPLAFKAKNSHEHVLKMEGVEMCSLKGVK